MRFHPPIAGTGGIAQQRNAAPVPERSITRTAMQEADDSGSPVAWGEHVTAERYDVR